MIARFSGEFGIRKRFADFLIEYRFRKLLFIAGCGFESRTTRVLELLARNHHDDAHCLVVDLLNRSDPHYARAQQLQRENMAKMIRIATRKKWPTTKVVSDLYTKRFVAHNSPLLALSRVLKKYNGDVLVDISCLPRSIVFPVLRVLWDSEHVTNLFVVFTDDTTVGHLEHQAETYRAPYYVPLFEPGKTIGGFSVWLPILGADYTPISSIFRKHAFNDIYPIVGFPSSSPIESDEIVRRNQDLIRGRTNKVIFASMNDPFQLAMKLNMLIDEIRSSLGNRVRMIISPHGSKPQSVGAFITAVMANAYVLYCQPLSYSSLSGKVGGSHLYWLKGDAYRG